MMAMSHVATSVVVWSLASQFTPLEPTPAAFLAVVVGSLLPDIDHPKSWLGRRLLFISAPLSLIVGHRGITHSLLAATALLFALFWWGALGGYVVASLCIGYLGHLAGDFLTKGGIPVFWPLKRRFSLPLFGTGGLTEFLFVVMAVGVAAAIQKEYWVNEVSAWLATGAMF
ncbi:metal-dependent hydrolase [Marinobacter alkaliphilus]|uniref:Metal-dependent hydrolase n=1 Tax=Marinobacter alkaliphilus TaxID=254719 RepID=A0ABZ3E8Z0_9GAMM